MYPKFMSTMTGTPVWSQGFELSSYSEVVNNAMHLYGPPVPSDLSSRNMPLLISDASQVRLFPCMNFNCSGRIRKLMFVSPVLNLDNSTSTVSVGWPVFGLWRKSDTWYSESSQCQTDCYWVEVQNFSITYDQQPRLVYNTSNMVGIYELELTSSPSFQYGEILGVRLHSDSDMQQSVLYQNGGGYCDATLSQVLFEDWQLQHHPYTHTSEVSSQQPIVPYIAIETGEICHALIYTDGNIYTVLLYVL